MSDAVAGTPVTSANALTQTNTSLAVAYPAAAVDTLMVVEISGDATGTGVAPTGMASAGWTKAGEVSDTNSGTATSSNYIGVFWRILPAGTPSGTSPFIWTNAGQMESICTPYTSYDPVTPVVWQVGQEKTTSDANYVVAGTTTDTGLLACAFANRSGSTAFSSLPDSARATAIVGTTGCIITGRITAISVASGTAFSKTAVGTTTSVGTSVAYLIRGASSSTTGAAALSAGATLAATSTASSPGATALTAATTLAAAGAPTAVGSPAMTAGATLTATTLSRITRAVTTGANWIAHRGGQAATLGEETLEAYQASAAQYSQALLEISVWDTSDGVYVGSHDSTTGRVFSGTNYTINATTWATLSPNGSSTVGRPVSINGGNPLRRLEELLDAFPTRLFVIENKHGTNQGTLSTMLDAHAAGRWMFKGPYNDTANANTAAGHGAPMWLYFYPANLGSLSSTYSAVSAAGVPVLLGLGDYSAAPVPVQSDADTFFSYTKANSIRSWAHIIGTSTQKSTADSQATVDNTALNGYMVSGFSAVAPTDGATGTAALTAGAAFTATGRASATAAASFTASTTLTAAGQPAAMGSASFGAGTSLTATGSPAAATTATPTAGTVLAVTGAPKTASPAALATGATLTATAQPSETGTAALLTGAALSTTSTPATGNTATLAAGASLAATGTTSGTAPVALTTGTALAATGALMWTNTIPLPTGATLAAPGTPAESTAAAFTAGSNLTAASTPTETGPAASTAGITLTALDAGSSSTGGSIAVTVGAALAAGGATAQAGSSSLNASAALSAVGLAGGSASPSFIPGATLIATPAPGVSVTVALAVGAALQDGGGPQGAATAAFTTSAQITTTSRSIATGPAFLVISVSVSATSRPTTSSSCSFTASAQLTATGSVAFPTPTVPDLLCTGWIEADRYAGAIKPGHWTAYIESDRYAGTLEATMSRTVRITAGDRTHVYFETTDIKGADLTSATAVVGFGDLNNPPAFPITPNGASDTIDHPAINQVRIGLFVAATTGADGAHVVPPGDYTGWIKPTDTPSTEWVSCGPVTII